MNNPFNNAFYAPPFVRDNKQYPHTILSKKIAPQAYNSLKCYKKSPQPPKASKGAYLPPETALTGSLKTISTIIFGKTTKNKKINFFMWNTMCNLAFINE